MSNNLVVSEDQLACVVSDVVSALLDNRLLVVDEKINKVNESLDTYIDVANDINSEVSVFKYRDKMEWGIYIDSALRDTGLKKNSSQIKVSAREFVKNIVLPLGTYESVVVTDMFSRSSFKREIHEACILCKEKHKEWFQ